jgi:transposase-like protein/IS1 family transposase
MKTHAKYPDGRLRFRCAQCGKTFSEPKDYGVIGHKQIDQDAALLALTLIVEGNSIRSTARVTGLDKKTITKLVVDAGQRCEALLDRKIRNVPVKDVQADEIWGFVGKKESHKRHGDGPYTGDAWCFIGIERHSKLVLCFELGKRTTTSATRFIRKLATATDAEQRYQLTTDGLNAYPYPIGTILGDRVDYAQLIKIYKYTGLEEMHRYSPPECVEAIPTPVYGDPEKERICTSHIERQNGSLRQWCKRLTRLTYAFSKKWENLRAALALHFAYYNFCRIHSSIRATPAMAAGLAVSRWTLAELLA